MKKLVFKYEQLRDMRVPSKPIQVFFNGLLHLDGAKNDYIYNEKTKRLKFNFDLADSSELKQLGLDTVVVYY